MLVSVLAMEMDEKKKWKKVICIPLKNSLDFFILKFQELIVSE